MPLLKGKSLTSLSFGTCTIKDLTALKGLPLRRLSLVDCRPFQDLKPLAGMPLISLELRGCDKLTDLTPLEGMKLRQLTFTPRAIKKGMDGIRRMKSLTQINGMPAAEFWMKYDAGELP